MGGNRNSVRHRTSNDSFFSGQTSKACFCPVVRGTFHLIAIHVARLQDLLVQAAHSDGRLGEKELVIRRLCEEEDRKLAVGKVMVDNVLEVICGGQ